MSSSYWPFASLAPPASYVVQSPTTSPQYSFSPATYGVQNPTTVPQYLAPPASYVAHHPSTSPQYFSAFPSMGGLSYGQSVPVYAAPWGINSQIALPPQPIAGASTFAPAGQVPSGVYDGSQLQPSSFFVVPSAMAAGVSALSADFSRTDALPSMMISPRATAVPLAMAAGAAATSQDSTIGGIFKDAGTLTYFAGLKSRGEPTQMIAKYGGVQTALDGIKEYLAERPKVWGVPGSKGNPVGGSKDLGTLTYFAGIKSRGEPTQMIAKYGGVQMKVNLITFEEWGKLKSDKIPFMPFITQPDGKIMLETENICKHLATMGGKFVVDSKQEELCKIANSPPMQLADPLYNLPDGGASLGVPPLEKWLEAVTPVLKDLVGKLGDGPFFAGEAPGYGEAFIFHNLDNQFALAKPELTTAIGKEAMAKLEAFYARFAALDGIKEYLAERPKVWGVPGSKGNPVGGSKDLGTLTGPKCGEYLAAKPTPPSAATPHVGLHFRTQLPADD
eukprot:CAMPEP_0174300406 /NCGR_PEP_ID=MMETSP0809-20121228/58442_1 /TAXON_ID=73025 ORGANISM="Eutreptiella gymnastica-like, Strain CCMP1594" /NCGR_SAMPLE_ID=MMETSP0809 /ASSEMBLY_ACC=CAM_ASM_000658 /LENGTH=502 /DNA_ID=CAMNT_0015405977 /DNA_START=23 /DNA_END=1531 /DNA_ORIENTATION=+